MTEKLKISEITLNEDIYPRQRISQKTVESYVEAIKGGAKFPPILVQKISNGKIICLDGWHRKLAYEQLKVKEVPVVFWKDEILDISKPETLEQLRIEATKRNTIHGDRLCLSDLQFQLLRIVQQRPIEKLDGIIKELAQAFNYDESYISKLIGQEVRKRKASRDAQIYKFYLLGYTQKEIANLFDLSQSNIAEIIGKLNSQVFDIKGQFEKGKSIEEIASFYGLDDIVVWSIILKDKSDLERFKLFGKPEYRNDEPMFDDVWNFPGRDPRLGDPNFPGGIPGQLCMNVLYHFTEQEDLVVDPMAGSGVMNDVCLIMNRKCKSYDINPVRKDIKKWDLRNGFPQELRKEKIDLIFLDPPYFKKKEYASENSVEKLDREEWLNFFEFLAKECWKVLPKGGKVAFLMSNYWDYQDWRKSIWTDDYTELFKKAGFKIRAKFQCPLTTQQYEPFQVTRAKEQKQILVRARDLIIFKKD